MLFFRQRLWLTGPAFMMFSLIFTIVFFIQCVSYYRNTQKYYRLQDYKNMIDDLTSTMNNVEHVANKSSIMLRKICKILQKKTGNTKIYCTESYIEYFMAVFYYLKSIFRSSIQQCLHSNRPNIKSTK